MDEDDIDALLADSGSEYEPESNLSSDSDVNSQNDDVVPHRKRTTRKNGHKDNAAPTSKNKPRKEFNGPPRDMSSSPSGNEGRTQPKEKPKRLVKPRLEKPFNRLFEGVIFTISGFQNPFRSELRSKAIEMGAKYRPDWDNTCTHLLCAFSNTPKFNQVLGHGKIITKEWIQTCYNRRMRIPWRRYALHPPDKAKAESEDEIFEYIERPASPVDNRRRVSPGRCSSPDTEEEVERVLARQREMKQKDEMTKPNPATPINGKKTSTNKENKNADNSTKEFSKKKNAKTESPKRKNVKTESPIRNNTQIESPKKKGSPVIGIEEEDNDVAHVNNKRSAPARKEKTSPLNKKPKKVGDEIPESTYDLDTEEEDEECDSKRFSLPHLGTFFAGLAFHISEDLPQGEYSEVRRYILAHKGTIVEEDDLSSKDVNYHIAVTEEEVKKVKEMKQKVISVKPEWVWKAHDEGRIPPTKTFEFS